jgi:tRNA(Ile)-lysidine synthase
VLALAEAVTEQAGVLAIERGALQAAGQAEALRLVGLACVCAGGGERRPAGPRLARLAARLQGRDAFVATLAGARVEAQDGEVRIFREAGEAARGGLAPTARSGPLVVWDGRFELAPAEGEVRPLAGLAARLPRAQQMALKALPPAARRALPALVRPDGAVACPALTGAARSLVLERLRAAAGLVAAEPD